MAYYWHQARAWFVNQWRWVVGVGGSLILVLGIIWGVFFLFLNTTPVDTKISGFSWKREMQVEDYQQRRKGQWDFHPDDAYDIYEDYRYHYSYQQYDGETCYGTGNSRFCTSNYHTVTVYDWWYEFTVDRWEDTAWLLTEGTDQRPLWHGVETEGFNDTPAYGNRRLGDGRHEIYMVYFIDKNEKAYQRDTFQAKWETLAVGDSVVLNINRQGDIRSVGWPKGEFTP